MRTTGGPNKFSQVEFLGQLIRLFQTSGDILLWVSKPEWAVLFTLSKCRHDICPFRFTSNVTPLLACFDQHSDQLLSSHVQICDAHTESRLMPLIDNNNNNNNNLFTLVCLIVQDHFNS